MSELKDLGTRVQARLSKVFVVEGLPGSLLGLDVYVDGIVMPVRLICQVEKHPIHNAEQQLVGVGYTIFSTGIRLFNGYLKIFASPVKLLVRDVSVTTIQLFPAQSLVTIGYGDETIDIGLRDSQLTVVDAEPVWEAALFEVSPGWYDGVQWIRLGCIVYPYFLERDFYLTLDPGGD